MPTSDRLSAAAPQPAPPAGRRGLASAVQSRRAVMASMVSTILLGGMLTLGTSWLENRAVAARFDRLADLVTGNLEQRMAQHITLLRATQSYLEADRGRVDPVEFRAYVASLGLGRHSPGIQGIGVAPLIDTDDTAAVSTRLSVSHGLPVTVHPASDQPIRAPITLLEPLDLRNRTALGYDMFAEPLRRAAILAARDQEDPRATAPVMLVQEITADKQAGFLIYLRARTGLDLLGTGLGEAVVYAPFRAGDLHQAVLNDLPDLPLTIRTVDIDAPTAPLFDATPKDLPSYLLARSVVRTIDVAGRRWQLTLTPTPAFRDLRDRSLTMIVGGLSLLLIGAVAVAMNSLGRSLAAAHRTAELAERQAADRTLILREMQHRIKNHIARIQAIARQSMRGAADLDEFQQIFGGRLTAMAKAQDALGRDAAQKADLHALLRDELVQTQDAEAVAAALNGPPVELGERETQAVALVAHELVTNAMKYGGQSAADGSGLRDLRVTWAVHPRDGRDWLEIDWHEPHARPAEQGRSDGSGGFGTQLIEALVEGDLDGRFTRRFDDAGMRVTLGFPLTVR